MINRQFYIDINPTSSMYMDVERYEDGLKQLNVLKSLTSLKIKCDVFSGSRNDNIVTNIMNLQKLNIDMNEVFSSFHDGYYFKTLTYLKIKSRKNVLMFHVSHAWNLHYLNTYNIIIPCGNRYHENATNLVSMIRNFAEDRNKCCCINLSDKYNNNLKYLKLNNLNSLELSNMTQLETKILSNIFTLTEL